MFMPIIRFLFVFFIMSFSVNSFAHYCYGGFSGSSPSAVCTQIFPTVTSGNFTYSSFMQSATICVKKTLNNVTGSYSYSNNTYISQCSCPSGREYVADPVTGIGSCVLNCVSPAFRNPDGQCQTCPTESNPGNPFGQPTMVSPIETCVNYCVVEYTDYHHVNPTTGFTETRQTHYSTGAHCTTGEPTPPPPPGPVCDAPSVVRSDGTCGPADPVCKSWEMLQNHTCVDKPCPPDKKLKCGTVNGVQECLCSANYECQPGTALDAFGNCIPKSDCPAGQTKNPITLQCGAPPDPSCPNNTHREGLTCVADPSPPGQPDPPKTGPGSGDLDGDGQSNSNDDDSDGDGKRNGSDSDADNDGTPNSSDSTPLGPGSEGVKSPDGDFDGDGLPNKTDLDRDGDGEPNSTDQTPDGPGSKPDTDPNGDNDGDGVPNKTDADADLDGDTIPNYLDTDRDGDGIPNAQDPNPDGPGTAEDPKRYDPSKDLDGDGIPNANDNDRDGDGIPNASDSTPDGPGSKPGADTDLDGDGIPNGQDGDIDGDGIANGEDKYPYGGGTGDGTGDDKKTNAGTASSLEGFDLYESKQKTFSDVWSAFTTSVQSAPIALAGSHFFSVSGITGTCQTYSATIPFIDAAVTIDAQCSSEVAEGLRIAGLIVLIIAAWVAFRIALL